MLANRSMPRCTVIPELAYPDVIEAIGWLCEAFGFTVRLRIGGHRAQLNVGDGAVVVMQQTASAAGEGDGSSRRADRTHAVMVRVEDVLRHHEQASRRGARILRPPAEYPYGERQYTAEDTAGHVWTFSESIADVAPEQWGGTPDRL